MTQLAQAYIHLKPYSASGRQVRSLGRYAQHTAIKAAAEIYGGGVEIEVQIEEGSLITRVTVVGVLTAVLGTYNFVANYKGFKEGIIEMCHDAREFAVDVCAPFAAKAGVPKEDIYRFERRLKTPGKMYRLGKRLDKLEHSVDELSPRDIRKELAGLRDELDSIARELSPSERKFIEPALRRPKLPPPDKWPAPDEPRVGIHKDEEFEQPLLFGEDLSLVPEGDHKRRLVFNERSAVPRRPGGRRKKRIPNRPDLL